MNKENIEFYNLESDSSQSSSLAEPSKIPTQPKVIEIITRSSVFKYFLGAMIIFGVCFVSCMFVFQVLFTQIEVIGYSMLPTINQSATGNDGDKKTDFVYYMQTNNYKREDIVIIKEGKTPSNAKLIKRIIAVPGDSISFVKTGGSPSNGRYTYEIYLNNNKLVEDYIYEQDLELYSTIEPSTHFDYYTALMNAFKNDQIFVETLEENEYFVMGDNRNNSTDSRYFGPVKKSDFIGKVVLHVEYGETLFNAIFKSLFNCKSINYV